MTSLGQCGVLISQWSMKENTLRKHPCFTWIVGKCNFGLRFRSNHAEGVSLIAVSHRNLHVFRDPSHSSYCTSIIIGAPVNAQVAKTLLALFPSACLVWADKAKPWQVAKLRRILHYHFISLLLSEEQWRTCCFYMMKRKQCKNPTAVV